jgi:hypothetical protein
MKVRATALARRLRCPLWVFQQIDVAGNVVGKLRIQFAQVPDCCGIATPDAICEL